MIKYVLYNSLILVFMALQAPEGHDNHDENLNLSEHSLDKGSKKTVSNVTSKVVQLMKFPKKAISKMPSIEKVKKTGKAATLAIATAIASCTAYYATKSVKEDGMVLVSESYNSIVDEFLKSQSLTYDMLLLNGKEGDSAWAKFDNIEYAKLLIGKDRNMPSTSAPLIKWEKRDGKVVMVDSGWPDRNKNGEIFIISISDMIEQNKDLLPANINTEHLLYSVTNTMLSEEKFSNWLAQMIRRLPDDALPRHFSNSAMKVKSNTLLDYHEEKRNIMLYQWAHFKTTKNQRWRALINEKNSMTDGESHELYKILGYKNPEEFIQAFNAGEISTRSEAGIALGIIIVAHLQKDLHISPGIITKVKQDFSKYGINVNKGIISTVGHSFNNLTYISLNDRSGDGRMEIMSDRVSGFYPTNIPQSYRDGRLQMIANFTSAAEGRTSDIMVVDGVAGDRTLSYLNKHIRKENDREFLSWEKVNLTGKTKNDPNQYDKTNDLVKKEKEYFDAAKEKWLRAMYDILKKKGKNDGTIEIDSVDISKVQASVRMNADSLWYAYNVISQFASDEEASILHDAFRNYAETTEKTRDRTIFALTDDFIANNLHNEDFRTTLIGGLLVVNSYAAETGFLPSGYAPAQNNFANISNVINPFGRAVNVDGLRAKETQQKENDDEKNTIKNHEEEIQKRQEEIRKHQEEIENIRNQEAKENASRDSNASLMPDVVSTAKVSEANEKILEKVRNLSVLDAYKDKVVVTIKDKNLYVTTREGIEPRRQVFFAIPQYDKRGVLQASWRQNLLNQEIFDNFIKESFSEVQKTKTSLGSSENKQSQSSVTRVPVSKVAPSNIVSITPRSIPKELVKEKNTILRQYAQALKIPEQYKTKLRISIKDGLVYVHDIENPKKQTRFQIPQYNSNGKLENGEDIVNREKLSNGQYRNRLYYISQEGFNVYVKDWYSSKK